jgi:hypothetical protein
MKPETQKKALAGRRQKRLFAGVTLMEVMFATGIVMIGLLGIASLLPLANRQANDSYVLAQSAALGQNWMNLATGRTLYNPASYPWLVPNDEGDSAPSRGFSRVTTLSGLSLLPSNADISTVLAGDPTTTPAEKLGFCIDPLFWSGQSSIPRFDYTNASVPARPSLFPYFTPTYDPLTDPTVNQPQTGHFQPRLVRVTRESQANFGMPEPQKVVDQIFSAADEIISIRSQEDQSLPAVLSYFETPTEGPKKAQSQLNFSWIATLVPSESNSSADGKVFRLSIVVFSKRNRGFYYPAENEVDPPDDERVALVIPKVGNPGWNNNFTLPETSLNVGVVGWDYGKRKVRPGNWIMLSRQYTFSDGKKPPGPGSVQHVHKWYKVVSVSSPSTAVPADIATKYGISGGNLWYQDVRLVGSDWIFQEYPTAPPLPLANGGSVVRQEPTVATIVPDVVGVYERTVVFE